MENKITGQAQKAVLQAFLTIDSNALKNLVSKEQYEAISQSRDIMEEVWESSAFFLRILQRLFQETS